MGRKLCSVVKAVFVISALTATAILSYSQMRQLGLVEEAVKKNDLAIQRFEEAITNFEREQGTYNLYFKREPKDYGL